MAMYGRDDCRCGLTEKCVVVCGDEMGVERKMVKKGGGRATGAALIKVEQEDAGSIRAQMNITIRSAEEMSKRETRPLVFNLKFDPGRFALYVCFTQ